MMSKSWKGWSFHRVTPILAALLALLGLAVFWRGGAGSAMDAAQSKKSARKVISASVASCAPLPPELQKRRDEVEALSRSLAQLSSELVEQKKAHLNTIDKLVGQNRSLQVAHRSRVKAIKAAHLQKIAELQRALTLARHKLKLPSARKTSEHTENSVQDVKAEYVENSSANSPRMAERAQLRLKLKNCEASLIQVKHVPATAKTCGLTRQMIRELNR